MFARLNRKGKIGNTDSERRATVEKLNVHIVVDFGGIFIASITDLCFFILYCPGVNRFFLIKFLIGTQLKVCKPLYCLYCLALILAFNAISLLIYIYNLAIYFTTTFRSEAHLYIVAATYETGD